jgi:hypothetical protein
MPILAELHGLILHQGNQGRDDYDGFIDQNGGQLITERFASARGHHYASIMAAKKTVDNAFLQRSKGIVAPVFAENSLEVGGCSHRSYSMPQKAMRL